MFFENRVLKTLERIRSRVAVSLRIQLWDGQTFDFCSDPNVIVTIPDSAALRYFVSPSLDFRGDKGLRYAVSIDDAAPVTVNIIPDPSEKAWNKAVADNVRVLTTRLEVPSAGPHRVKLWRVDPGVVFQRLVLSRGPLSGSYLGPVESVRR